MLLPRAKRLRTPLRSADQASDRRQSLYHRARGSDEMSMEIDDMLTAEPWLKIGDAKFRSRLIVGIEQYDSVPVVRDILTVTGADVFITTVDPDSRRSSLLLADLDEVLPLDRFIWIGTTSFSRSKESALRTAHILRDSWGISILKLDVRGEDNTPDNRGTVEAAHQLRAEGMELMPFILPDLDTARQLEEAGCAALRACRYTRMSSPPDRRCRAARGRPRA